MSYLPACHSWTVSSSAKEEWSHGCTEELSRASRIVIAQAEQLKQFHLCLSARIRGSLFLGVSTIRTAPVSYLPKAELNHGCTQMNTDAIGPATGDSLSADLDSRLAGFPKVTAEWVGVSKWAVPRLSI